MRVNTILNNLLILELLVVESVDRIPSILDVDVKYSEYLFVRINLLVKEKRCGVQFLKLSGVSEAHEVDRYLTCFILTLDVA